MKRQNNAAPVEPSKVISFRVVLWPLNPFDDPNAAARIDKCVELLRRELVRLYASGHAVMDCGLVGEKE